MPTVEQERRRAAVADAELECKLAWRRVRDKRARLAKLRAKRKRLNATMRRVREELERRLRLLVDARCELVRATEALSS